MADKLTYLSSLPSAVRDPLSKLFHSGAALTNSLTGSIVERDENDVARKVYGTAVPDSGTAGYAVGCEFRKTDAAFGQTPVWINVGSSTSCLFVPVGQHLGYGFVLAGNQAAATGSATQTIVIGDIRVTDIALLEYSLTDDTDVVRSIISADGKLTAVLSADPLAAHVMSFACLRNLCDPDYDIFAAGTITTATAQATATTITGVLAGDIALVSHGTVNAGPRTIASAVCTANTLTVNLSGAPTAGDKINYVILRPRGSFKPAYYIVGAGVKTSTADGSAPYTNDISVPGALSTDIPIVSINTNSGTNTMVLTAMATGILTVTYSADPSTTNKWAWMVLRSY